MAYFFVFETYLHSRSVTQLKMYFWPLYPNYRTQIWTTYDMICRYVPTNLQLNGLKTSPEISVSVESVPRYNILSPIRNALNPRMVYVLQVKIFSTLNYSQVFIFLLYFIFNFAVQEQPYTDEAKVQKLICRSCKPHFYMYTLHGWHPTVSLVSRFKLFSNNWMRKQVTKSEYQFQFRCLKRIIPKIRQTSKRKQCSAEKRREYGELEYENLSETSLRWSRGFYIDPLDNNLKDHEVINRTWELPATVKSSWAAHSIILPRYFINVSINRSTYPLTERVIASRSLEYISHCTNLINISHPSSFWHP